MQRVSRKLLQVLQHITGNTFIYIAIHEKDKEKPIYLYGDAAR